MRVRSHLLRAAVMLGMLVAVCVAGRVARAAVFLAKDEALALAFPDSDRIEERIVILTDAQKAEVEKRARAALDSQLWTIHVGWKGGVVQGYVVIDSHIVRTLPETFMVVVDPDGKLRRVDVLAFHEPPEYQPTERWMAQFQGRSFDDDLKIGTGVQGITGATLSAQAMTAGVRRALALVAVALTAAPVPTPAPEAR